MEWMLSWVEAHLKSVKAVYMKALWADTGSDMCVQIQKYIFDKHHIHQEDIIMKGWSSAWTWPFVLKVNSTFHRSGELVLSFFWPNPKHPQERELHYLEMKKALSFFLNRTQTFQKTFRKLSMGQKVSISAISRWASGVLNSGLYVFRPGSAPGVMTHFLRVWQSLQHIELFLHWRWYARLPCGKLFTHSPASVGSTSWLQQRPPFVEGFWNTLSQSRKIVLPSHGRSPFLRSRGFGLPHWRATGEQKIFLTMNLPFLVLQK